MATTGLSHARALTPVDDPIHTRYEFNLIDRALIDSTYFQRLHFVLQNSTNYISFPANKNTRFPHSLGVAHVAGRMFSRGLSQATSKDLTEFLSQAANFLVRLSGKLNHADNLPFDEANTSPFEAYREGHKATISGFSGFLHTPLQPDPKGARVDTEDPFGPQECFTAAFIVDTFWQALRLYGLMHDIGHLPMSHAFEVALKNVSNVMDLFGAGSAVDDFKLHYSTRKQEFTGLPKAGKSDMFMQLFADLLEVEPHAIKKEVFEKDFHEIRGISIYNRFISRQYRVVPANGTWKHSESIQRYATLIYYLSVSIILSSKASSAKGARRANAFLYPIKRIVDGEVDADRLDYTLRDCSEAGSQLGAYDLEQIVTNCLLVRDQKSKNFSFGFFFRGVSGVEQFYEQRYSSYKYIIHHRTASRSNTCLEYLISMLFTAAFKDPAASCAQKLAQYGYISIANGKIISILPDAEDVIERIDDASLRTMLFDMRKEFPVLPSEVTDTRGSLEQQIAICLDVVLLRRLEHVETAFKNQWIADVLRRAVGKQPTEEARAEALKTFTKLIFAKPVDFWGGLRSELTRFRFKGKVRPVGLLTEDIVPKVFYATDKDSKFEETVWVVKGPGVQIPLSAASASLRLGADRRETERQLRVYIVSKDIKATKGLAKAVEQRLEAFLAEQWNDFTRKALPKLG